MPSSSQLCVTSFGPTGYELYGKRFLETFVEHVDSKLLVYIEGLQTKPAFTHSKIEYRDLMSVNGLQQTLAMSQFPAAKGHLWGGKDRNYRFDIHKFCRKSFAQIDAAQLHYNNDGKQLYWIDSDVEFQGAFELPSIGTEFMLYLDRPEWHSCASFIGWDLQHPISKQFFQQYWALYVTGTVFALPEWHDSFVLDWLRHQLKIPAKNLAAGLELKGPANVFDEVFETAHHKKGNLKFTAQQS